MLAHPAFKRGDVDTRFLDRETPAIAATLAATRVPESAVAAAVAGFTSSSSRTQDAALAATGGRSQRLADAAHGGPFTDPWDVLVHG